MGMGQSDQSLKSFNDAMVFDPQLAAPLFGMAEAYWLMANRRSPSTTNKLFMKSSGPDKENWMTGGRPEDQDDRGKVGRTRGRPRLFFAGSHKP